jgi:steroid 5-alpha reductase family enzyme
MWYLGAHSAFGEPVLLSILGAVLCLYALLWVASLVVKDASIVDWFWGISFIVIATAALAASDGYDTRRKLVALLVALWGLRLSFYLTVRNLGAGEDFRYRAMRREWGKQFALVSLFTVFLFQGLIAWIVSLPVQSAIAADSPAHFTALDFVGVLVWSAGFLFETVADWQLARFKTDPRNKGRLLDRGLWRYTRHPNYFGDAVQWWGLWMFAAATGAWWTAIGPAVMTFLLVRVSGVKLLEQRLVRSKPDYEEYCRRTSAFIPMKPSSS